MKNRLIMGITTTIIIGAVIFASIIMFKNNNFSRKYSENEIIGGIEEHHIYLKPGETKRAKFIIYTRNKTWNVRFVVWRVSKVGDTHKIATPKGLNVSVIPSKAKLMPNRKYTFDVVIKTNADLTGMYTFLVRAYANGKALDDWLRILVAQNPNPGFASFYLPRFRHVESVTLKAGESIEISYTLYTGESPPGIVKLKIYRVESIYKTKEISMPKGLNVSVAPPELLVSPHRTYTFKIKIKTDHSLPPGRYVFCIIVSDTVGTGKSWLTLNVR